jgi:hypothetical protein
MQAKSMFGLTPVDVWHAAPSQINVQAGVGYAIVVDGYNGNFGSFDIAITADQVRRCMHCGALDGSDVGVHACWLPAAAAASQPVCCRRQAEDEPVISLLQGYLNCSLPPPGFGALHRFAVASSPLYAALPPPPAMQAPPLYLPAPPPPAAGPSSARRSAPFAAHGRLRPDIVIYWLLKQWGPFSNTQVPTGIVHQQHARCQDCSAAGQHSELPSPCS